MKKILVTGGAGFIGAEIVNQLFSDERWDITVLDSMTEQIHGKDWKKSYLFKTIEGKRRFIKGSVCDLPTVQEAINDCETILHLAAETGTGQSMYQINQYNETNEMGTSNLLQAISLMGKTNKVRKIILSSSRSVYGVGFTPAINLNDGLKEFCAWVVGQDKDNSGYEQSLYEM